MYEFWCDYVIPKCDEKPKFCYMNTGGLIVYIKKDNICKDIAEDLETRFDTSHFELNRQLSQVKDKKVTELMKDELGRKIMIKPVGLKAKTYSYLIDGCSENKKAKAQKSVS